MLAQYHMSRANWNSRLNHTSKKSISLSIIRRIMRWNLHSNACDVLALGPRTAGQLATVGIRTVNDLLVAQPQVVARRLADSSISSLVLSQWQREAALIVELPELPTDAARLLAAADFARTERIASSTPTELLAALELARQSGTNDWLASIPLPSVAEASLWIEIARQAQKSFAA